MFSEGKNRLSTSKSFTGNKLNLTEIFDFLKSNMHTEIKVVPKINKEDEMDIDENGENLEDQNHQIEDEVIDLSHRYDSANDTSSNITNIKTIEDL